MADAGCLLCRSDFRVGDCAEAAGTFFTADGVHLVLDEAAALDTARDADCFPVDFDVPFVCVPLPAPRGVFFTGSGGGGSLFTRDDLRTPLSKMVVGPSAAKGFQGGDTARETERCGVVSSSLRRFEGRSRTRLSSFRAEGCSSALMGVSPFSAAECSCLAATGVLGALSGAEGA